jgi:hypothetical protein
MRVAAVPVARKLLAAPAGNIGELWVHPFASDEAAHDDAMQAQLERDFAAAFEAARSELAADFGPPLRFGEAAEDAVPLNGVFCAAVWSAGDRQLWLAAAHEDREMPFLLLMGTAPG